MVRVTHVGGPTTLLELDGWRILTDPTFDPPGRRYWFGWGTSSTKTAGPALALDDLGTVDVVLLSHDHHADNLDDRGRECLTTAGTVLTTRAAASRLEGKNICGLSAGQTTVLEAPGRPPLTVLATPCRHGPPLSRPIAGQVIGFALSTAGSRRVSVWMTGDTVLYRRLRRVARDLDVDVLVMHLGRVRFPVTGPLRYSMDGHDAIELLELVRPRVAVPVHYGGWSHFSETPPHLQTALDRGGARTRDVVTWLTPGTSQEL